ncbi:MAG: FkbM family methyltransferase [Candidatus Dadabacteria bacterium]|nr:MAG: FkbM family methyltransferase [Candidatus Dadabacteria bacterium]
MKRCFYKIINELILTIRRKNYRLFRAIVDNRFFYFLISKLFARQAIWVKTPEGINLCINPIYHGQFATEKAILKYEQNVRAILNKIVKKGMTVYDIGANVGIFSILCSFKISTNGKVFAFEPERNNVRCLIKTKRQNQIDNLVIIERCVSNISGTKLFDHRGGSFSGRIVEEDCLSRHHKISPLLSLSLDDFVFKQHNPLPDVIKIDVEGHEFKVIQGMVSI